jgi:hypothetical protein
LSEKTPGNTSFDGLMGAINIAALQNIPYSTPHTRVSMNELDDN